MLRNCPQCGRNLTKADRFFCSACGASLGDAAGLVEKRYFKPPPQSMEIDRSEILSLKGIVAGVALFLLLAASIFSSSFFTEKIVTEGTSAVELVFPKATVSKEERALQDVTDLHLNGEKRKDVESLIPFSPDFAAVFYSPSDFLDALSYFGVENAFSLDFLKDLNRPPYSIVIKVSESEDEENNVALLFFTSDPENKSSYVKYVFGDFTSSVSEDLVVVSNDIALENEIIQISKGLKKGLILNSYYVNVKNKIPEKVRSEIFVLTDNGVGYVNGLDTTSMPATFSSLVLNYMRSGSYYGFIEYD